VSKVDAGPVFAQVRPEAEPGDRAHELGTKTLQAAARVLSDLVPHWTEGKVIGRPQDLSGGRVYRQKDFQAEAVRCLWHRLDDGMVRDYVENRAGRDAAYPIVEWAPAIARVA
jgi:methionyl-tRNA formyltransferase